MAASEIPSRLVWLRRDALRWPLEGGVFMSRAGNGEGCKDTSAIAWIPPTFPAVN